MASVEMEAAGAGFERDSSPGYRSAVLAAAAFVVVLLGIAAALTLTYRRAVVTAREQAAKAAEVVGAETDQTFAIIGQFLAGVGQSAGGPDLDIARTLLAHPLIQRIVRLDAGTRLIGPGADAHSDAGRIARSLPRQAFMGARAGRLVLGAPFVDKLSGQNLVPLAAPLFDAQGRFAGATVALIDQAWLSTLFRPLDEREGGAIGLFLPDGREIAREAGRETSGHALRAIYRLIAPSLGTATAEVREVASPIDGRTQIVAYRRTAGGQIAVLVAMPLDAWLGTWQALLRGGPILAILVGGLLMLVTLALFRREAAARRALSRSTERYRRLADNLPGAVYSLARQADGSIVYRYMSRGAEDIFGYPPGELVGSVALTASTVHPEDAPHLAEVVAASAADLSRAAAQFRIISRSGEIKWVQILAQPYRAEDDGIVWDGVMLDVTASREADARLEAARRELQEKNRHLDAAFNHMTQGLILYDAEQKFVVCNSRYCEIYRLPPALMRRGASLDELMRYSIAIGNYTEAEGAEILAERRRLIARGQSSLSYQTLGDGRIVEVAYEPLSDGGGVATYTDVTAVKRHEAELAAKTALLQVTLERMGEGISVFDGDFRLTAWNDRFLELLALPPEMGRVGVTLHDLIEAQSRNGEFREAQSQARMREENMALRQHEPQRWESRRANGTILETISNPMPGGGFVTLYRDITEMKRAASLLLAAKEEAEAAARSKGEFLANMSHELRTPLNAIIGFSEILQGQLFGPLGDPRYVEYARDVHLSGTHLLDLINDVLDMSKIEAGRFELTEHSVDLGEILAACEAMVKSRAVEGGVDLALGLAPGAAPGAAQVWADGRALKQVLLNLLSNAVKFTPAGGRVTVGLAQNAEGLDITVGDTGIGIPVEAIERVLEPFGQADATISRKFGGTGLGLPISRRLVELHQGRLTIESEVGLGTSVTVHLPPERILAARVAALRRGTMPGGAAAV